MARSRSSSRRSPNPDAARPACSKAARSLPKKGTDREENLRQVLHFLLPCMAMFAAANGLLARATLRITSPTNAAIVQPGETVLIDMSVSCDVLTGAVIAAQDPIKDSQVLTAPPYRFSIK